MAADVAKFIAPFLPFLIAGTKAAAEEAGKQFGKAAWDKAVELWGKLKPKVEERPAAQEAVEDLAKNQENEDAQAAFRRQLTKLFEADEVLVNFIAENITFENRVIVGGSVENATIIAGKDNTVINANTYIQGNVYNGPAPRNPQDALKIYRAVMANMTSSLSMRGIDLRASDPNTQRAIGLANVYIDLDTTIDIQLAQVEIEELKQRITADWLGLIKNKKRHLSMLDAVVQNRTAVIKGDPGSGKSTFVNYLTHCLSTHATEKLADWKKEDADVLPVIVILRDFVKSFKKLPEHAEPRHLWDFIEKRLKSQNLSASSKPIQELLEDGKVIVFLDGLDEVSTIAQRVFVRDVVHAFVNRYPKNRFVVTCRVLSYTPPKVDSEQDLRLTRFLEFELAPFDDEKIENFIDAWYRELTNLGVVTPEMASDLNTGLKTAVRRPELSKLAPNPLLLTVMAVVNTHKGRLPDARALLYKETVEILLWQWEQASKGQDAARLRQLLLEADCSDADLEQVIWKLAYEAHAQSNHDDNEESLAGISEINLQKSLAGINKGNLNWAASVIEAMKMRAGLLLERDNNVFTFPHRSFQEFLASTYLESKDDFVLRAKELTNNQLLWRQVVLWAVSRRVYIRGSLDGPLALIAELCPSRPLNDEKDWSKVWLAGDILLEVGLNRAERSELGRELMPRVQNRLVELLEGSHLTSRERAEAGNTLAKLGDPRFDEMHLSLPKESLLGFVHIPAGEFLMGTKEEDIKGLIEKFGGKEEYYKFEIPQHKLHLPDYYIARYPVTVAQFKAFFEDSGYKPTDKDSLLGIPNHPVRYVTWYDAMKYCEWLTEKLKAIASESRLRTELEEHFWREIQSGRFIVTLPSEAEWEKAARCDKDARTFPWGDVVNLDKVNANMVIGTTSPVGCFPQGKNPYELQDISGNVWEWTRSIFGPYKYDSRDGRENLEDKGSLRVLRGGSFTNEDRYVRCPYRNLFTPNYLWSKNIGFRVAACASYPDFS